MEGPVCQPEGKAGYTCNEFNFYSEKEKKVYRLEKTAYT
jgi:hypothetical protein